MRKYVFLVFSLCSLVGVFLPVAFDPSGNALPIKFYNQAGEIYIFYAFAIVGIILSLLNIKQNMKHINKGFMVIGLLGFLLSLLLYKITGTYLMQYSGGEISASRGVGTFLIIIGYAGILCNSIITAIKGK